MTEININYEGDLYCRAVHKSSGAAIQTDAPLDNHGRGQNFSPTDLVATALGTCMVTLVGIVAKQHGIDIEGTRVTVRKEMTKTGPRRIARLEVDYFMPFAEDHPQRKILETAARGCPVHHSLHPDVEQKITFHYNL